MAKKNRSEQKQKREELIAKYVSELSAILASQDEKAYNAWLVSYNNTYERACKLIAEREVYSRIKALGKEVKHVGA